jgi:polar amino acid transport system substrate-binding protein
MSKLRAGEHLRRHIMRALALAFTLVCAAAAVRADASELAPTGTLRAAFIATNPVQARVDPSTGEVRGPAADLTRALAQQLGVPFTIKPAEGVAGVIDSVKSGAADIGFVAYDATRAEQVDFSQTYLLAHNSYIVPRESALRTVADIDRPRIRIGVGERDAGDLFLTRTLKSAELRRTPSSEIANGIRMLIAGELDAYAANRTRLIAIADQNFGVRVLPDNFYSVEQAIAVAKGNAADLAIVDRFLNEARSAGLIQAAVERAGLKGVDVAPAAMR